MRDENGVTNFGAVPSKMLRYATVEDRKLAEPTLLMSRAAFARGTLPRMLKEGETADPDQDGEV